MTREPRQVGGSLSIALLFQCAVLTLVASATTEADRHRSEGIALAARGEFAAARTELQKALDMDPSLVGAQDLADYLEAVTTGTADTTAARHFFYALEQHEAGSHDAAIAAATQSIEHDAERSGPDRDLLFELLEPQFHFGPGHQRRDLDRVGLPVTVDEHEPERYSLAFDRFGRSDRGSAPCGLHA